MRSAAQSLMVTERGAMRRETLAGLYPMVQQLEDAIGNYRQALRLALADGPIEISDGREIRLQERTRSNIDARKAWPVLRQHMTDDEIAEALTVKKKAVEDAVKARAGKGMKGKAAAALIQELRDAGAVETSQHTVTHCGAKRIRK
jgi:hypothetical protein